VQEATSTGIVLPAGNTSAQIYPRLPELNGFCLLIKRSVINQVGCLEGAGFGQGLAGETDYGMRALKAGWQLALADDVHVSYKPS
jgi:GT2 family glycosyltransferase